MPTEVFVRQRGMIDTMEAQNHVRDDHFTINQLLSNFARFGVKLGLESTQTLLRHLDNPHQKVPIIHVAGTNGKGSVCAYLSSVLTEAGYRVGRYTSPHLVDWTERICIRNEPIQPHILLDLLQTLQTVIHARQLDATQFEVITAAAWLYFAQQQVDIAVIEVGLGGRLDATNVCDRPLASVITSISRDHWQQLGSTLAEIATEKAGILKHQCPAIVGPLPPEAEAVVRQRVIQLHCPTHWVPPATVLGNNTLQYNPSFSYTSTLVGPHQRINSALAIATLECLQKQGWAMTTAQIQQGLATATWPGRLQWIEWQHHKILVDGAHNEAAAIALRQYVNTLSQPIHWIMGMLATKDHQGILQALLNAGDRLSLVPIPEADTADLNTLKTLAETHCPGLHRCQIYPDVMTALHQTPSQETTVLCGSLYLVGHVLKETRHSYAQIHP